MSSCYPTHARRELVHVNVTASPTAALICQQYIEDTQWDRKLRYVLRDRDATSGCDFVRRAHRLGSRTLLNPL